MTDMERNVKKVKSIVHIINLILGLFFWGAMYNFICVYCHKFTAFTQFVDATAAGFLITMFILCIGICTGEETERQTEMTIAYMGAIFYTLSTVFLGMAYGDVHNSDAIRLIIAMCFAILLAVSYFFEAIYSTFKKEMLETEV